MALLVFAALGLAAREWLLHEELRALQSELTSQIREGIHQAQDAQRLQEFQTAPFVNERYLEPVVMVASRLIVPGSSQEKILSWRREMQRLLSDQIYMKQTSLTESIRSEIDRERGQKKSGFEKLKTIIQLSENLPTQIQRTEEIEKTLAAMQKENREADEQAVKELKAAGQKSLGLLRKKMNQLKDEALTNYLSSRVYSDEIDEPVIQVVMNIRHPELRKKSWAEFRSEKLKIFQNRFKGLARAATPKSTASKESAALAELLKQEYQREMERERLIQQPHMPVPESPASSTPRNTEILELGQP